MLALTVLLLALGLTPVRAAWADEAVFTLPNCTGYEYPVALSTRDGNTIEAPAGGLYCEASKVQTSDGYALTETLGRTLGARTVRRVDLTAYYFRDKKFADWLCSLSWTDDALINVYHQRWESGVPHVSNEFYGRLRECSTPVRFRPVGCDVFDDSVASVPDASTSPALCKRGSVAILHAKIWRFITTNGETIILTGSGNVNKSLYANVDDWLVLERSESDPLAKRVECMFSTLNAFVGRMDVKVAEFRSRQESCLNAAKLTKVRTEPQIILTPFGGTQYFSSVITDIKQADSVWVTSQFLGDKRVINALSGRTQGEVKILLDDDNYWSLFKKRDYGYAEWKRVKRLKALQERTDTQIRYLQTNHHSSGEDSNMLHTRIIMTSTAGVRRVYTGSAHWRQNSFVFNMEQQLVIEKPELVAAYTGFLERLWERGLSDTEMPLVDVPATNKVPQ